MEDLKKTVHAILFAAAKPLKLEEIAMLCKKKPEEILPFLNEIKQELIDTNSSIMMVEELGSWKLTVKEQYIPVIRKIVTKTDIPKSILETLAVVSYKAPIQQSKVIAIRTNKAYGHSDELEQRGFITREKQGRTKLIKLTQKFFDYFDLPPERLKEKFKNLQHVELAIEQKEKEYEEQAIRQQEQSEERLKQPHVTVGGQEVNSYDTTEIVEEMPLPAGVEIDQEKLGDLDVYEPETQTKKTENKQNKQNKENTTSNTTKETQETTQETKQEQQKTEIEEKIEQNQELENNETETTEKTEEQQRPPSKGLYTENTPPEIQAKIDEKVKKILGQ